MKIWYCLFNRVAYAISYGVIDAIHMPTSGISRYHLIPNRCINKILRQIENYDNLLPGLDGTVNLLYIDDVFLYWLTGDGGSSRLTAATRKSSALSIIQLVSYKNTERKRESRTRLIGLGPVNASSAGSWILAHLPPPLLQLWYHLRLASSSPLLSSSSKDVVDPSFLSLSWWCRAIITISKSAIVDLYLLQLLTT